MEGENIRLKVGQYKGQSIAVVTSGGDSQGMNATLRAIVRVGLYIGCKIFYIKEGYQGMISGGENIIQASWSSVSSIIHKGGTVIGSARSQEFMTLEGRQKCCKNLVQHGISNLIVIGGDGSLTGARVLKNTWPDLLTLLLNSGDITQKQVNECKHLRVVGLVGTIDNDFPETNMTIGTDTALHRILEAVNAIASTATSHRRTFILEVMGRHCGYLALKTAMTTEADYVFIPEMPSTTDWRKELENKITSVSYILAFANNVLAGKRLHLIILAEGAISNDGKSITAAMVKHFLTEHMKLDARITVLGHVQRGGSPSAYDRILGSRSGAEAVIALMELKPEDEPIVIVIDENKLQRRSLGTCIEELNATKKAVEERDFESVIKLRGPSFFNNFEVLKSLNKLEPKDIAGEVRTFAILQVGTPACGMNAAVFSFVRHSIHKGGRVLGIFGGIEGLLNGSFTELKWADVTGFVFEGGSYLGTKKMVPSEHMYSKIADNLRKFEIEGLVIIGGFEAFQTAYNFSERRKSYPPFCIPIAVIPATINNNVPGSEFSIGADTALNTITRICDLFRQSALGTKSRVFIVEIMGGKCGYMCSMAALASGADSSYIYEEPFQIDDIITDVRHMISKMKYGHVLRGLVLRNEECNENYTTDFMTKIYAEEGKEAFTARKNVLGHIQQGDIPSSFDRSLGVKLSCKAVNWFYEIFDKYKDTNSKIYVESPDSVTVIGLFGHKYCSTTVKELLPYTDFENRDSKCKWWMNLRFLLKILALHESNYSHSNNT